MSALLLYFNQPWPWSPHDEKDHWERGKEREKIYAKKPIEISNYLVPLNPSAHRAACTHTQRERKTRTKIEPRFQVLKVYESLNAFLLLFLGDGAFLYFRKNPGRTRRTSSDLTELEKFWQNTRPITPPPWRLEKDYCRCAKTLQNTCCRNCSKPWFYEVLMTKSWLFTLFSI